MIPNFVRENNKSCVHSAPSEWLRAGAVPVGSVIKKRDRGISDKSNLTGSNGFVKLWCQCESNTEQIKIGKSKNHIQYIFLNKPEGSETTIRS